MQIHSRITADLDAVAARSEAFQAQMKTTRRDIGMTRQHRFIVFGFFDGNLA